MATSGAAAGSSLRVPGSSSIVAAGVGGDRLRRKTERATTVTTSSNATIAAPATAPVAIST
eukprot:scaffold135815_cov130-Phaeocystis_antarctica.AAC.1